MEKHLRRSPLPPFSNIERRTDTKASWCTVAAPAALLFLFLRCFGFSSFRGGRSNGCCCWLGGACSGSFFFFCTALGVRARVDAVHEPRGKNEEVAWLGAVHKRGVKRGRGEAVRQAEVQVGGEASRVRKADRVVARGRNLCTRGSGSGRRAGKFKALSTLRNRK